MNMNRIMGVLTLKAATYREIADDKNATMEAAIIVVVVGIVAGLIGALLTAALSSMLPAGTAAPNPIIGLVQALVSALIGWVVGSWVFAFVSKTFFGGKTDTGEMLRVFGYTNIFGLLGIVPVCGSIVGLVLSVIGAIIGIREASEFDTTKAILTGVIGFVILLIVSFVIGAIFGVISAMTGL